MSDPRKRLDEILTRLRQREFRITPQRIAILQAFLETDSHPSVEEVYNRVRSQFPTTSLATVYKTVNLLKEIGEILEIAVTDGRKRYDGNNPFPHPHLVCTRCHRITDPPIRLLEKVLVEVATATGYRLTSHQLELFGVCPACQKNEDR